jgi:hypothetical protein
MAALDALPALFLALGQFGDALGPQGHGEPYHG